MRGANASQKAQRLCRQSGYLRDIACSPQSIGTLHEGSLHAALKASYAADGGECEVPLDGFVIDIRRSDQLIEIQTGCFGALGPKFDRLLDQYRILLVHPIAIDTYLLRPGKKTRKSAQRGSIHDVFHELVSLPTLLDHPNLTLEVVLVSVTAVQESKPRRRRAHQSFRTTDRRLREVREVRRFSNASDLAALLPDGLALEFTTADIAAQAGISRALAQRMAYCFRALELINVVDRSKRGIHYSRAQR